MTSAARALAALTLTVATASLPGCAPCARVHYGAPMTPEESLRQVVEAGRDVVATLGLDVVEAYVRHAACHDGGAGPYRGRLAIRYPRAVDYAQSARQVDGMLAELRAAGWAEDPDIHTHGSALSRNRVMVFVEPQSAGHSLRSIAVVGECRDRTTTRRSAGDTQPVSLR